MNTTPTQPTGRRTIRRFAHELYPHAKEGEDRPLEVEVPHLYAMATGLNVWGTDWYDLWSVELKKTDPERAALTIRLTSDRTSMLILARQRALHADALLQGLTGQEAWEWAESRMDEEGGWVYERAEHYGVPIERIKPYPVLAEPDHHDHDHKGEEAPGGGHFIKRVAGRESECDECTEPIVEVAR